MKYPFEKHFLVCTGARCSAPARGDQSGEKIQEALKDLNKSLGRKATVRVCRVSCLDLCDHGPNMIVWPEGEVYSGLDVNEAVKVYRRVMGDEEGC